MEKPQNPEDNKHITDGFTDEELAYLEARARSESEWGFRPENEQRLRPQLEIIPNAWPESEGDSPVRPEVSDSSEGNNSDVNPETAEPPYPGLLGIFGGEPYAPWGTHENFVIPAKLYAPWSRDENFSNAIAKPEITNEDAESDGSELKFDHAAVATSEAMVASSLHPQATPKTLAEATENMWRERDDETPTEKPDEA